MRMDDSGSVAVVVPSWNTLRFLPRCLDSLRDQGVELELIVVDNGSDDGSLEYLRREGIRHVALPRNIGFAAAVNLGAARTDAASILVLNADTALEPGCVGRLHEALRADPTLGGVQPRILQLEDEGRIAGGTEALDLDDAPVYSAGQALTRDGRAFERGMGQPQSPQLLREGEVFGVCGAACLLRRELFAQLGGYEESYFAFYEDVELSVRARIAGWRFGYVPEAVVWHVGNAAWRRGFGRPAAENARLVARNRLLTQLEFVPARAAPRIAVVEVGALLRAAWQRRFVSTLRGKQEALRGMRAALRRRRRLAAAGDLDRAREWLGRAATSGG
jgi:GT2 family glycosyltransferase